ncbi:MAG TPA: DUF4145 domain-containing protein [Verrucomicrobiota bacterium]|nr:hypothetical protein [Verrucomicrobiales bacterium]HRI13745.1 DUF4145 domain-containing protein [Verrucomicrobiota bacterium]
MGQTLEHNLEALYRQLASLTRQVDELRRVVAEAEHDSPTARCVALRKVLQEVLYDVHFRRFGKRPGSGDTLEQLQIRLLKEGSFPEDLRSKANLVRELGNDGAHMTTPRGKNDVALSLGALLPVLEWYFRQHRPEMAISEQGSVNRESARIDESVSAADPPAPFPTRPKQKLWLAVGFGVLVLVAAAWSYYRAQPPKTANIAEMVDFATSVEKAMALPGNVETVQTVFADWQRRAHQLPATELRGQLLAEIEAAREAARLRTLAAVNEHLRTIQRLLETQTRQ